MRTNMRHERQVHEDMEGVNYKYQHHQIMVKLGQITLRNKV